MNKADVQDMLDDYGLEGMLEHIQIELFEDKNLIKMIKDLQNAIDSLYTYIQN